MTTDVNFPWVLNDNFFEKDSVEMINHFMVDFCIMRSLKIIKIMRVLARLCLNNSYHHMILEEVAHLQVLISELPIEIGSSSSPQNGLTEEPSSLIFSEGHHE